MREYTVKIAINAVSAKAVQAFDHVKKAVNTGVTAVQNYGKTLKNTFNQTDGSKLKKISSIAKRLGTDLKSVVAPAMTKFINKLKQLASESDHVKAKLSGLSSKLKSVVAIGGITALALSFSGALKPAIDFESVMADVKKVVNFDTPKQFEKMSQDILKLSTEIPITAKGFGEITASAGQAGIARKELKGFAVDAAKLSVAFDITAKESGSAMTGLRTIFKLNQKQVMDLAGTYNELSNNFDATARDILNVGNRVGKLAMTYKITGKELASFSTVMLEAKVGPEETGTALNTFIGRLGAADKQGKKFQSAMKQVGLPVNKFKSMLEEDASGALNVFLQKMQKVKDKAGVMTDLFGIEHAPKLLALVNNTERLAKVTEITGAKRNWASSVEAEYAARSKTTANALTLMKNRLTKVAIEMGSVFLPPLNNALKAMTPMVDQAGAFGKALLNSTDVKTPGWIIGIKEVFKSFKPIISDVKNTFVDLWQSISGSSGTEKIAVTIGKGKEMKTVFREVPSIFVSISSAIKALGSVVKPVFSVVASVIGFLVKYNVHHVVIGIVAGVKAFVMLKTAIMAIGIAMKVVTATNPILLAITAILAAGYLIYSNWDKIKVYFVATWNYIKSVFVKTWDSGIIPILLGPIGLVIRYWDKVKSFFSVLLINVKNIFVKGWKTGIIPILLGPVGLVIRYWDKIKTFFTILIPKVKTIFIQGWKLGIIPILLGPVGLVIRYWSKIKLFFSALWIQIKIKSVIAWQVIKNAILFPVRVVMIVWNRLKLFFVGLWNQIKIFAVKGWQGLLTYIRSIPNMIISVFTGVGGKIMSTIAKGIIGAYGKLKGAVVGTLKKIRSYLPFSDAKTGPLSNLTGSGKGFVTAVASGIESNAKVLQNTVSRTFSGLIPDQKQTTKIGIESGKRTGESLSQSKKQDQRGSGVSLNFNGATFNFHFSSTEDLKEGSPKREDFKENLTEVFSQIAEGLA